MCFADINNTKDSILKIKSINELKNKYEFVRNFKSKYNYIGKLVIEHEIVIIHKNSILIPSMSLLWRYDEKTAKWILISCFIMTKEKLLITVVPLSFCGTINK